MENRYKNCIYSWLDRDSYIICYVKKIRVYFINLRELLKGVSNNDVIIFVLERSFWLRGDVFIGL